MIKIIFTYFK